MAGCFANRRPSSVDLSRTGDSILTDILDGIAHCQLFLADISTVGKDSKTTEPYRNRNVMYEVGLALSCRHSSEVLLIRDDYDKSLFDVSTIPQKTLDFTAVEESRAELESALRVRLLEQNYLNDARLEIAKTRISSEEFTELAYAATLPPGTPWGAHHRPWAGHHELAISRLLDKQIVKMAGGFDNGHPAYRLTPLGEKLAAQVAEPTGTIVDILPPATRKGK